ncbi:hypothetical protein B0H63DRAFT_518433 [Podospora didyma]|uniref:Uncharacterized protein n=1 Tax=Podospora didyma TaxID=330526 RepID=A0AAE0NX53_9PEZI|nr:hypothetical protein B0H63DRAFT_518433 [Podospora didyma]
MRSQSLLFSAAALFTLASALPLNINLGAYSPALVVGDGAISFEGEEKAAGEGAAAVEAAAAPAVLAPPTGIAQASVATPILTEAAQFPVPGSSKELDPRLPDEVEARSDDTKVKTKRDLAGFDRALKFAEVALTKGPKIELGTGGHGSGVGIIVDNHASAAAAATPATAATAGTGSNNGIIVAKK